MVNGTLQWTILTLVAIFMLGALRHVAVLVPPAARAVARSGPRVRSRAPRSRRLELDRLVPNRGDDTVSPEHPQRER